MSKKIPAEIFGYKEGNPIIACFRHGRGELEFVCPICGRTHTHCGGKSFGEEDGFRVAHCVNRNHEKIERSYYIKEVYDPKLAGFMREKNLPAG